MRPVRAWPAKPDDPPVATVEREEMRGLAREFARGEIRPRAAEWERAGAFGRDVLDQLAELGFMGMLVPERYGGLGLDAAAYVVALEELAWGDASVALTVAIQNGPVPRLLLAQGAEEQKSRWLPRLASGDVIAGFAVSEDGAGSDPASLTCTARQEDGAGGEWVVSGAKRWVTNGAKADAVFVFARTGEALANPSRTPVGAFLVDTAAEGYRPGPRERTMGLRASETVAVDLEQVRVDAGRLVGGRADGMSHACEASDMGRLGIAAQAVGIAQAALEHAAVYTGERRQFGKPVAAFGGVRSKLAVMATRIAASRALLLNAAERLQAANAAGKRCSDWPAMAKLTASETAAWVTDQAVNLFGGYGYMREFPVEKLMRDAKGTEIYEGTNEILRTVIGRSVTNKGEQTRWQS